MNTVNTTKRFLVFVGKHEQLTGSFVVRRSSTLFLHRVGGELHYLGSHAPLPIRRRWRRASEAFLKRHMKPYKMVMLGIVKEVI